MSEDCEARHRSARGGHCLDRAGHTGSHWAFEIGGPGYKFRWANVDVYRLVMDDATVARAAEAVAHDWPFHSNYKPEMVQLVVREVLKAAVKGSK